MSSWLSFENFFYSRAATRCRYGLLAFGIFGVSSDYYLTHHYEAFDRSEGQYYVVDWSPIGKPRCQMLLIPNNYYTNYSPWTPKNGAVVLAKEVVDEPNYLQLLNGRFVERWTCGVELMRPLAEVQQEATQRSHAEQHIRTFLSSKATSESSTADVS